VSDSYVIVSSEDKIVSSVVNSLSEDELDSYYEADSVSDDAS
jgi:hypothetical protein